MAAPRGQQRAGGVSAIHVWLIVFVALWLLSTVLLVWLYTDQAGLEKVADELRLEIHQSQTKLGEEESARQQIAELAVGATDDDAEAVTGKVEDLYGRIQDEDLVPDGSAFDDPSTGLLAAMTSLYEAYRGEYDSRVEADADVEELQAEMEALANDKTQREQAFEEKADELVARISTLEADVASYREQRDSEIDAFETHEEELRQQHSSDIQEQRKENAALKKELAEYKSRYQELQAKFGQLQITPEPLMTVRQGDGRVLTAKAGEDVVYISLGRRQRITRGMQFAVYGSDAGIPADGRAKARIEVARVFPETSECVVRELLGNERIIEGDIINNPIYDRARALTFVVAGEFDLSGDGHDDADGAAQVETLIRDWGGRLLDTVSARVDYVVLGNAPRRPASLGDLSPEAQERQAAANRVYEQYDTIVETAKALSVPILTQEIFLHFLGYAGSGQR
ncbi:MAG: BRCT domain-containing protein [Planctomycetota bacterium]|jgi:hypothetical protein